MEEKLKQIFNFLKKNRQYNHSVQNRFYVSAITPHKGHKSKISSLLYHVASTQSQPKINLLSTFFQRFFNDEKSALSLEHFINFLNPETNKVNFEILFEGLKDQPGWGDKTSALFVKSIYHLHNGKYSEKLKIWTDVPNKIKDTDRLYLPVDSVIIPIFQNIAPKEKGKWDFKNINKVLQGIYSPNEMEIWDDLWFWGFITQKGSGTDREFVWNENKYWILPETSKDPSEIAEIRKKSTEFLELLNY